MALLASFGAKPEQAIEYLRGKGYRLTFNYAEMSGPEHHRAFTVAKVVKQDLLSDIRASLEESLQNGTRFEDWKKQLKPTLQKHGWWGRTEVVDPETGEVKEIYVGSRRLRHIFKTNMRQAYNCQREQAMDRLPLSTYRRYVCMMLPLSREKHQAAHNTVLPANDPWWLTNSPGNGHGCKCKKQALSAAEAKRRGLAILEKAPPRIAEEGWEHGPCDKGLWDKAGSKPDCMGGTYPNADKVNCIRMADGQKSWREEGRPDLRTIPDEQRNPEPQTLPRANTKEEAYEVLKKAVLGSEKQIFVKSPVEEILLTDHLLTHAIEKMDGRERYANFLLPALTNPYEVWLTRYEDNRYRMRYISLFGGEKGLAVIARVNLDGSIFWNMLPREDAKMNKLRMGWLVWGK